MIFEICNPATIEHNFGLTTTVAQTEATTWEHAFGASLTRGFSASVPLVDETSLSLILSYNFKTGGSSSETNTQQVSESFKVRSHDADGTLLIRIVR